jgi:hypothetical protein
MAQPHGTPRRSTSAARSPHGGQMHARSVLENPFSDGYSVHPGEQEGPRKLATASKLGHRRIFGRG